MNSGIGPGLDLHLLGRFDASLNGAPLGLRYDKLRALLAYLAVEAARPHPREALASLLWPETPDADARRNLSQALFNLRQALGEGSAVPPPATPFLLASREALQFNSASPHTLDVADFQALLDACATHPHARLNACDECAARLAQAAELYQGDFLAHFFLPDSAAFEEWALLKREELRRRALQTLAHLTAYAEQQADYAQAAAYARRQLALEPWREEAHRDLMRLLALDGQRSAALAQYEACRKVLADELGVSPSAETEALLEEIKAGRWQAPAAEAERATAPMEASAPRSNLPASLTAFVGRERELAEIAGLLTQADCRLLTLVGPGGMGKTRLALQAAVTQRSAFPQGAAWVALAAVNRFEQVLTTIADALGVTFHGGSEPAAQLVQHLQDKALLLVLDNFEHLLAEPASTIWLGDLLRGARNIKLLVTSREALNLEAEWVFPVEGLGDEALALFVQSARRARAGFELRPEEAASVARLCELVGAMPLAVELAAAWVRVLSCAEIVEEIERAFAAGQGTRLDLFSTPARDVPEQHRSLAAVFDHSWRLLSADEQTVLSRLAVFRGGFSRAAAEQVAGASLAVLAALHAKSLLRWVATGRYDLHELVRQYATAKLAQVPDALKDAHNRHCGYYARFMAERADDLRGSRQREAGNEIAAELDNVRAAWDWAIQHGRLAELRQAAITVYLFSQRRSRYRQGTAMLTQAITRMESDTSPEAEEAVAGFLLGRGWLGIRLGRLDAAEADFERAQALFDRVNRLPQHRMVGDPVMALGLIASIRGDYAAAIRHYEAALEVITPHGDHQAMTYPHLYLASIQRAQGNYAAAERCAQQAYALAKVADQPWLMGFVLNELGQVAHARADYAAAQSHLEAAYALREKLDDASGMALDLSHLGQVALSRRELGEAQRLFERSLALYRDIGDQGGLVTALHGLGRTAAAEARPVEAWGHLTQALEIANHANFVPVRLAILASLAEVLAESGAADRARRLAAAVISQPEYDHDARTRAECVLERLGSAPTSGRADAAEVDLASTIATVLAEPIA